MTGNDSKKFSKTLGRTAHLGLLISVIGIILLIFGFLMASITPLGLIVITGSLAITAGGVVYDVFIANRKRRLLYSMEVIERIKPENVIITPDFVLGKKQTVFILTFPKISGVCFVKFRGLITTEDKGIQLPKLNPTWDSGDEINNVNIHKAKGICTIPINKNQYGRGEAIVYFVLTERTTPETRILWRTAPSINYPINTLPVPYTVTEPINYPTNLLLKIVNKLETVDAYSEVPSENLSSWQEEKSLDQ
ncbi:MAG: hypothetical protein ACFFDI_16330 [Promethearchaeota archaeon]